MSGVMAHRRRMQAEDQGRPMEWHGPARLAHEEEE